MPKRTDEGPQGRILDAAEDAFADAGFDGASLRRIGLEAKVNLATIYYYFGSKAGLMEAVLRRRFGPLREEHLGLLRQFEQGAKGAPVPAERILEAMLLPALRLAVTASPRQRAVSRLLGRIFSEPNPRFQKALRGQHERNLSGAFLQATHLSLPAIPLPELRCRLDLIWGAMGVVLCNPAKMGRELRATCEAGDIQRILVRLVAFFGPGLRAPVPPEEPAGAAGEAAAKRRRQPAGAAARGEARRRSERQPI